MCPASQGTLRGAACWDVGLYQRVLGVHLAAAKGPLAISPAAAAIRVDALSLHVGTNPSSWQEYPGLAIKAVTFQARTVPNILVVSTNALQRVLIHLQSQLFSRSARGNAKTEPGKTSFPSAAGGVKYGISCSHRH